MPCRPVLDFHRFYGPIHTSGSPYSNSAPIHSRSPHTHSQSPCIPIPPYWPHARRDRRGIAVGLHRRHPYASVALRQFIKNYKVRNPTFRRPYTVAHVSQIPMRLGSSYEPCSYTFYADPTYCRQAPKIRLQFQRDPRFRLRKSGTRRSPQIPCVDCWRGTAYPDGAPARRDQRSVHSNLRIQPVYANSPSQRRGVLRQRRRRPCVQARLEAGSYGPRAWIPEESGQVGFNKSPQTRRQGNRIRKTNDRSRRPPARPGVTRALRR